MNQTNQSVEELINRLQGEYQLKEVNLKILDHELHLYKVADMDALLDRVSEPDEIPFWAELWPASVGLAKFILEKSQLFKDYTVLELGTGVGLAGMAAKMAGAHTTQSDFLMPALEFSRLNCRLNHLPEGPYLLADWRTFPAEAGYFDRIIGGDILYERTLHACLLDVMRQHLVKDGKIILADPGRDYAKIFIDQAVAEGWVCETSIIPVYYDGKTHRIQVHQLSKQGNL